MILDVSNAIVSARQTVKSVLLAGRDRTAGQAMVEYVMVAGILTAMVLTLAVFLYTFREYSGRTLDLVSSDYP